MKVTLEITAIQVLTRENGPDIITFQTTLPEGGYPFEGQASADMKVAHGRGVEYVKTHLGVDPKVIDVR